MGRINKPKKNQKRATPSIAPGSMRRARLKKRAQISWAISENCISLARDIATRRNRIDATEELREMAAIVLFAVDEMRLIHVRLAQRFAHHTITLKQYLLHRERAAEIAQLLDRTLPYFNAGKFTKR